MDTKTQQAVEAIHNGTLAQTVKKNMKYAFTGIAVGAAIGIVTATLTGKCRFCFGFWGAVAGGSVGYLSAPKEKFHNCAC